MTYIAFQVLMKVKSKKICQYNLICSCWRHSYDTLSSVVRFTMDEVALKSFISQCFGSAPVCIIQPVLYTYSFFHPSLTLYDLSNWHHTWGEKKENIIKYFNLLYRKDKVYIVWIAHLFLAPILRLCFCDVLRKLKISMNYFMSLIFIILLCFV